MTKIVELGEVTKDKNEYTIICLKISLVVTWSNLPCLPWQSIFWKEIRANLWWSFCYFFATKESHFSRTEPPFKRRRPKSHSTTIQDNNNNNLDKPARGSTTIQNNNNNLDKPALGSTTFQDNNNNQYNNSIFCMKLWDFVLPQHFSTITTNNLFAGSFEILCFHNNRNNKTNWLSCIKF